MAPLEPHRSTPLVELPDDRDVPLEPQPDLASRFGHVLIREHVNFLRGSSGTSWLPNAFTFA